MLLDCSREYGATELRIVTKRVNRWRSLFHPNHVTLASQSSQCKHSGASGTCKEWFLRQRVTFSAYTLLFLKVDRLSNSQFEQFKPGEICHVNNWQLHVTYTPQLPKISYLY